MSFIFLLKEVETLSLTLKQEVFVQKLIEGCSQREAYKFAYKTDKMSDRVIDNEASKLFNNREISVRYEDLKKELKERSFIQ